MVTVVTRLAASAAAVLVTVGFVAASRAASALPERGVVRDARNDAKAPWDITKIVVFNGARDLHMRMVMRGRLRPSPYQGLLANIGLDIGRPATSVYTGDFTVDMLRGSSNPDVPDRLQLIRRTNEGTQPVRCRDLRLRARYKRRRLDFFVPRHCLGRRSARVRIAGHVYTPRGEPDEADYIREWSRWFSRVRRG